MEVRHGTDVKTSVQTSIQFSVMQPLQVLMVPILLPVYENKADEIKKMLGITVFK